MLTKKYKLRHETKLRHKTKLRNKTNKKQKNLYGGSRNFCNTLNINKNFKFINFNIKPPGKDYNVKDVTGIISIGSLEAIMQHQTNRFAELEYILEKNPEIIVIIAGDPKTNKHALGTGLAIGQWKTYSNIDINTQTIKINNKDITMNEHITQIITNLQTKFGDRVKLGAIGLSDRKTSGGTNFCNTDSKNNPSKKIIHVWGANENNWNLPTGKKIDGGGQVDCLENQTPGVFGIVTTYWNGGHDTLFTDTTDKLKDYFF